MNSTLYRMLHAFVPSVIFIGLVWMLETFVCLSECQDEVLCTVKEWKPVFGQLLV